VGRAEMGRIWNGVDRAMAGVWITGIHRRTGSTAQAHQPRSDTLRSISVGRGEAREQGHGATLGRCRRRLDGLARQLWITG
jgi:hypothetical protein